MKQIGFRKSCEIIPEKVEILRLFDRFMVKLVLRIFKVEFINYDEIMEGKQDITMKYLFFDLEYAASKGGICKICEFGYVLVDEMFNIIERDNIIINPKIDRSEWDDWVVKKY